jgi:hypothetical protein
LIVHTISFQNDFGLIVSSADCIREYPDRHDVFTN